MKAVILAANRSERLNPFIQTRPKPMIRVGDKFILTNTIEFLKEVGVREVIIVVNHKKEMIQEQFLHGEHLGVKIEYVTQDPVDGIGQALVLCQSSLNPGDPFLLVYGDVLSNGNLFQEALKTHYENGENIAVVALPSSSEEFGNVYLDHTMKIRRFVEKPEGKHANYVFAGAFILSSDFFHLLEVNNNDMEAALHSLIEEEGLSATVWEDGWIDIIYPWHILEANIMMMNLLEESRIHHSVKLYGNVQISGAVIIEENVTIESGTILKGPCFIGKNSYIGNNTLIRKYSVLGPNSTIGYGCELKNCVLLGTSTIGRLSFIGDSVVGENVNLGSGITTVNHWPEHSQITFPIGKKIIDTGLKKLGAFIGDNVIIGARHTLGPGTVIDSHEVIPNNISIPLN